ncbi:MAG: MFS transporter [Actinomycetota bacterium]
MFEAGSGEEGLELLKDLRLLWANRRYRFLLLARFVSNIGNGMSPVALAFGVLSLPGGDATDLSYVTTSRMIPIVVFLLIGGVVADRFGRAQLVGGTDIIGALVIGATGLLFIFHQASVVLLCISGAIFGVLNALWYPAFSGLMPEVVESEHLQSANSVLGFGANIGFTIGASAAGIIVSQVGPGWAIVADGGSFLIAGLLVWQLRQPVGDRIFESHERESMIFQMKEGWREFVSKRWLVIIVATFALTNMSYEGFFGVLAPLQIKEEFDGARDMGFMMSAFGIGSIVGVVVSMRLRPRRPLVIAMVTLPVIGLWMLLLAGRAPMIVVMLAAFASGVALDIFYVLWMTTFQREVPEEMLSRVGSYDAFGSTVLAPLGLFFAGPLASWAGAEVALVTAGAVVIGTNLIALTSRSVRSVRGSATEMTPTAG